MTGPPLYASLDDLKPLLNISNTAQDDALTNTLSAVSRGIDQDCNRRFYADADALQVRTFIPDNEGFVILDDLAVLTSLVAQSDTWTLNTDFYLEPMNAPADGFPYTAIRTIARPFLYSKASTPAGWVGFDPRIQITGKWGWPGAVPDQIQQATLIQAAKVWKRPKDAVYSTLGIGLDGAVVRTGSYDAEYEMLVAPFRRRPWFG